MTRRIFLFTILFLLGFSASAQEASLAETLAERPELSQFAAMLELADSSLLESLNDPEASFTIFAPTDSAFEQLATDMQDPEGWQQEALGNDSWEAVLEDTELVTEIVEMHIIPEAIVWDDLLLTMEETLRNQAYVALNGDYYEIVGNFYNTGGLALEEGIRISLGASIDLDTLDIEASNGVIYLIDYPLIPEIRTIGEIISDDASYGEDGEFLKLLELINAAEMMDMLNDTETEYTIFAPYDAVFESMDNFEELLADSEAATAFLQRYIIPQRIYNFEIGEGAEYEALNGDLLSLVIDEEGDYGEFLVNDAYVVYPNRVAKNGAIHELDSLMN